MVSKKYLQKSITRFFERHLLRLRTRLLSFPNGNLNEWKFFLNHFYFIEKSEVELDGFIGENLELYKRDGHSNRLLAVLSRDSLTWQICSVSKEFPHRREIDRNDEAALLGFIEFLFEKGFIVPDLE